jgi:hypothetical protein
MVEKKSKLDGGSSFERMEVNMDMLQVYNTKKNFRKPFGFYNIIYYWFCSIS